MIKRAKRTLSEEMPNADPPMIDTDDSPDIPSTADAPEAVRMRAVYDARKSRLASLAEGVRLDLDRRSLWTTQQVRDRYLAWNRTMDDRMSLVERLLDGVDGVNPEQRKTFLMAARAWCMQTKRELSSKESMRG